MYIIAIKLLKMIELHKDNYDMNSDCIYNIQFVTTLYSSCIIKLDNKTCYKYRPFTKYII